MFFLLFVLKSVPIRIAVLHDLTIKISTPSRLTGYIHYQLSLVEGIKNYCWTKLFGKRHSNVISYCQWHMHQRRNHKDVCY